MQFRRDTYLANHVLVYEMPGCVSDFREWIQFYIRQICLFEVTPNQKKIRDFAFTLSPALNPVLFDPLCFYWRNL